MDIKMTKKTVANFKKELLENADKFAERIVDNMYGAWAQYTFRIYANKKTGELEYWDHFGRGETTLAKDNEMLQVLQINRDDSIDGYYMTTWDSSFVKDDCSDEMREFLDDFNDIDGDEIAAEIEKLENKKLKNKLKKELVKMKPVYEKRLAEDEEQKRDMVKEYSSMFKEVANAFDGESDMQEIVDSYQI